MNKSLGTADDDLLFTKIGISGSAVFQFSRAVNRHPYQKAHVAIQLIDLSLEEWHHWLGMHQDKTIEHLFTSLLPRQVMMAITKELTIDITKRVSSVKSSRQKSWFHHLRNWRIPITGTDDFAKAQISMGGIKINEVYPDTLASKKIEGLYFAGELLDMDGACGGYNLQWAWSSGYVAGKAAITKVFKNK